MSTLNKTLPRHYLWLVVLVALIVAAMLVVAVKKTRYYGSKNTAAIARLDIERPAEEPVDGQVIIVQQDAVATVGKYNLTAEISDLTVIENETSESTINATVIITIENEAAQTLTYTEYNVPQSISDTLQISLVNGTTESIQLSVQQLAN